MNFEIPTGISQGVYLLLDEVELTGEKRGAWNTQKHASMYVGLSIKATPQKGCGTKREQLYIIGGNAQQIEPL